MSTNTYQICVDGEQVATMTADFAQASCNLQLDDENTPFQVADARHRELDAAILLLEWCHRQGGSLCEMDGEGHVDGDVTVLTGVGCVTLEDTQSIETYSDVEDAAEAAAEWYSFLVDDGRLEELPEMTTEFRGETVDDLNQWITNYESKIAEALGCHDFAGHGNYFVSAADAAGLDLVAKTVLVFE